LSAIERKQISAAHQGIVAIIPEVMHSGELNEGNKTGIDLSKSMESLFKDYFRNEKGQEPNEEIMKLLVEILAENEE